MLWSRMVNQKIIILCKMPASTQACNSLLVSSQSHRRTVMQTISTDCHGLWLMSRVNSQWWKFTGPPNQKSWLRQWMPWCRRGSDNLLWGQLSLLTCFNTAREWNQQPIETVIPPNTSWKAAMDASQSQPLSLRAHGQTPGRDRASLQTRRTSISCHQRVGLAYMTGNAATPEVNTVNNFTLVHSIYWFSTLCICMLRVYTGLTSDVWCGSCSVIDTYMLILHCLFLGLCSYCSFNVWRQRFRFY